MRLVFMGTPEFAVTPLEHLVLERYEVVSVYTQPDRPAGRGRRQTYSPVKAVARELGLSVVQPASLKKAEVVAQLAELAPDAIVVAAFGQVLPPAVLDIPRYGCLNLHPSLLPRFRGASPVAAAIMAGDAFTGVSVMLLDPGLDTGPLLAQVQLPISERDTTGSLGARLSQVAARLAVEVLVRCVRGEITPRPQDEVAASYCGVITKEAGEIDWNMPAVAIWRRVRAFQPWPGCYTSWGGKRLEIIEAVPLLDEKNPGIGRVVMLPQSTGSPAAFGVGCGDGVLGVCQVQLEGKRAMSAADFVRGQRQFIGAALPGMVRF